jgi:hypothetical protein
MKVKNIKSTYPHLEKLLTLTGLTLVIVGCIANLYGAYANQRFINDSIDVLYYIRYIILLGGGFVVGYLITRKSTGYTKSNQLFLGVIYATLAVALYWLFDVLRIIPQNSFGFTPPYPWGKMIFMGMPLLSLIAVMIIAYFSRHKTSRLAVSTPAKLGIILSFIVYQLYSLISNVYYLITGEATYGPDPSIWLIIGGYLITPLTIAIVAYLLFNIIKNRFDRLFYSIFIGAAYSILSLVLWEFRTDASGEATNIFASIVTVITLLFVGILLWRARRMIK